MINYTTGLADDQMANQWEILFPDGIPGGGSGELLKLRADQQFDMPERVFETYDVEYQGIKVPKVASKEATDKKFTLAFRTDTNWLVYKAVRNWAKKVLNEDTGSGETEQDTRISMIFNALGPGKSIKYSMRYNGVKIFSYKPTSWDHTSADPSRIECQFIYASVDDLV